MPMNMIRKQFFIDAEQNRQLKQLAESAGKSEGEVIRESLEALIIAKSAGDDDWRRGLERLSGAWADRDDMHDFVRELRQGGSRRLKRIGLEGTED